MRTRMAFILALVAAVIVLTFGGSASAITKGTYDSNGHPYVAYLDNGVFACTGTLLSPTVMLTAAHCFSDGPSAWADSVTGAPIVRVTFEPTSSTRPPRSAPGGGSYTGIRGSAAAPFPASERTTSPSSSSPRPVAPSRPGVLEQLRTISAGATLGQYGDSCREPGRRTRAEDAVDIVGYGVQASETAAARAAPCKKAPADATRFFAQHAASNDRSATNSSSSTQQGRHLLRDSGGPDLGGTNVVLAVNSFVGTAAVGQLVLVSCRHSRRRSTGSTTPSTRKAAASLVRLLAKAPGVQLGRAPVK